MPSNRNTCSSAFIRRKTLSNQDTLFHPVDWHVTRDLLIRCAHGRADERVRTERPAEDAAVLPPERAPARRRAPSKSTWDTDRCCHWWWQQDWKPPACWSIVKVRSSRTTAYYVVTGRQTGGVRKTAESPLRWRYGDPWLLRWKKTHQFYLYLHIENT